ncbi:MAG: 16S rRNA (cytidine(1402)-2'-O)-methyltransferase [Proteobacteria bacterium]|nr:16S rRNA (cytidine(1402)-2'-O)-methyltransferase [Pseudomonadota bacterium]
MPLYIVSVPIGNPDDITLRAIDTLGKVDFLICEEYKIGRRLLKRLDIQKELFSLNEHNEKEATDEIFQLLLQNKNAALFSDCGTPLFADPGTHLVDRCHNYGIRVIPVPGASSLVSALSVAGVEHKQFFYAGFLPRKSEERRQEIRKFMNFRCPVVVLDTPYRLNALLKDLRTELPAGRKMVLLLSLTQPDERIIRGSLSDILKEIQINPQKKEFVMIIEPEILKKSKSKKRVKSRKK